MEIGQWCPCLPIPGLEPVVGEGIARRPDATLRTTHGGIYETLPAEAAGVSHAALLVGDALSEVGVVGGLHVVPDAGCVLRDVAIGVHDLKGQFHDRPPPLAHLRAYADLWMLWDQAWLLVGAVVAVYLDNGGGRGLVEGDGGVFPQAGFGFGDGVLYGVEGFEAELSGDVEVVAPARNMPERCREGAPRVFHMKKGWAPVEAVAIAVLVDELGAVGEVVGEEVPELIGVKGDGEEALVELPVGG